jgi:hypothetical protein
MQQALEIARESGHLSMPPEIYSLRPEKILPQ